MVRTSFIALFALASVARGDVYLALASSGEGMGAMGHAFMVFTSAPEQLLGAQAYQYNLATNLEQASRESGPLELLQRVTSLGDVPFVVERSPAPLLVDVYRYEQRTLLLYPVKLTQPQQDRLKEFMESDRKARQETAHRDYSVVSNNCLTKLIDALNKVLDQDAQIPTAWNKGRLSVRKALASNRYLAANAPLFAVAMIQRHSAFGKPWVIRPAAYNSLNANLVILADLERARGLCGWSPTLFRVLQSVLLNQEAREKGATFDFLEDVFGKCDSDQSEFIWEDILLLLRASASSAKVKEDLGRRLRTGL